MVYDNRSYLIKLAFFVSTILGFKLVTRINYFQLLYYVNYRIITIRTSQICTP